MGAIPKVKCRGELGYTMPEPTSDALDQFDGLENDSAFMDREVKDDTGATDDQDNSSESDTQSDETKESGKSKDEGTSEDQKDDKKSDDKKDESEDTTVTDEEPKVPLHRFKQVVKENRQLRNQGKSEPTKPSRELTEEEQKDQEVDGLIEKKVAKALERREQRQQDQDTQDAEELVELMDVYGDFNVDKVLDIKDEFKKVGTTLSNEGALKIFFDRQKNPTSRTAEPKPSDKKPKVPQPKTSAPASDQTKTPQVTGRPLRDVVEEAKKEYGLK
jgi:hypothetical protein